MLDGLNELGEVGGSSSSRQEPSTQYYMGAVDHHCDIAPRCLLPLSTDNVFVVCWIMNVHIWHPASMGEKVCVCVCVCIQVYVHTQGIHIDIHAHTQTLTHGNKPTTFLSTEHSWSNQQWGDVINKSTLYLVKNHHIQALCCLCIHLNIQSDQKAKRQYQFKLWKNGKVS